MSDTVHASVARVDGRGVMIRGASGSGKSAVLLALVSSRDVAATLVADDRAALAVVDGRLLATVPPAIAGLMEIRGVGIVRRDYLAATPIDLVVDLRPLAECPRHPLGEEAVAVVLGVPLPRIFIATGAHDAVARVAAALGRAERPIPA